MDQRERFQTLNRIKKDECRILVATDVAARGLNMNAVQLVINYEVPTDPESYVHRIGRTARAGRSGNALTFVSSDEWDALHSIEKRNDIRIMQINKAGEPIERRDRPRANASS
jgi:ATP-dependent RNA helicase DDX49/DBP8